MTALTVIAIVLGAAAGGVTVLALWFLWGLRKSK